MDIVGTVTAPARLGFRFAAWGIRTAVGLLPLGDDEGGPATSAPPRPTVDEPPQPATAPPGEAVARPKPPPAAPPPPVGQPPEPAHVDEGATVVAEFAEEGAEEGAGAEVELNQPWDGYDRLPADEIVQRLGDASSETLAAVALYESSTRGRATVVEAAEERLRRRTGPGPT